MIDKIGCALPVAELAQVITGHAFRGAREVTADGEVHIQLFSLSEQEAELIRLRGPVASSLEHAARIYNAAERGLDPARQVELVIGLPRTTVTRWVRRAREAGAHSRRREVNVASIKQRPDGMYRARYRDNAGREYAKHFKRKRDAQKWLDDETAKLVTGNHVPPKTAETTVAQWCDTWLAGYGGRQSTVRQARVHVARIKAEFGDLPMSAVRPSQVKAWTARPAAAGMKPSYVYALYRRLSQVMEDAVLDGIIPRSPCRRRTSPPAGKQRPCVATTELVRALVDAMPDHLRVAVLLGAFAGLRVAEACGLTPVPVGRELTARLAAHVASYPGETILTGQDGGQLPPWALERAIRTAREKIGGLPEGFLLP